MEGKIILAVFFGCVCDSMATNFNEKYGNELVKWMDFTASEVEAVRFDPIIPGNILCAGKGGVFSWYSNGTRSIISSVETNVIDFVVISDEEIMFVVDHAMLNLNRTQINLHEPMTVWSGKRNHAGFAYGDRNVALFNLPRGLLSYKSDRKRFILVCDRINHRIRAVDIDDEIVHEGIEVAHYVVSATDHPFEPGKVLLALKHAVVEVDMFNTSQQNLLTGEITRTNGDNIEGPLPTARYSYPKFHFLLDDNDYLVPDAGNSKIIYISDIFNSSVVTTSLCVPEYSCLSGQARFLHDGDKIWWRQDHHLSYIPLTPRHTQEWKSGYFIPDDSACYMDRGLSYAVYGSNPMECASLCNEKVRCMAFLYLKDRCLLQNNVAMFSGGTTEGTCYRKV